MMKKLSVFTVWILGVAVLAPQAWAAELATAGATVQADIPGRAQLQLETDNNSAAADANVIVLNTYDDVDFGIGDPNDPLDDGSPDFMYAPKRSILGKNWHIARILVNQPSVLTGDVIGTVDGQPLANKLNVFVGGFFPADGGASFGKSADWENLGGFSRQLNNGFIGVASFNYRLDVKGLKSGNFNGTLTYTLSTL